MPVISDRGEQVPFSPFRKLAPYAETAKAKGRHVFHLNIGQPDIETPDYALSKLKSMDSKIISYCMSSGNLSYREKMTGYYRKYGIDISPEEIIVTNGASEGLGLVLQACLNPGEEVIAPEPFYANYSGFAHMAGVHIKAITCRIENGFLLPPVKAFENLVTEKTRAILLTNPNNPTGAFYSEQMLTQIFLLAKKYDLYLIVDEVYREFCFDEQVFFSALNLSGAEEYVVVVDSVSKRYSACGARVGAIVTRNSKLIDSLTRYVKLRLSPPFLGQYLAESMLGDGEDAYIQKVSNEYDRRRRVVYDRLQKMEGVTSYLPGGAFYCFAKFPIDDCNRFCQWLLEDFSYRGQTVMLAMGDAFYSTPGMGKQEVRIAYVLNCEDLNCAMDCLEEALRVYPGRTVENAQSVAMIGGESS